MKLEEQVTSLEISKRLKELGVKQESCFDWVLTTHHRGNEIDLSTDIWEKGSYSNDVNRKSFSAFTVAELGEMLPENYYTMKNQWGEWTPCYEDKAMTLNKAPAHIPNPKNEADLRGKMLIYLIENKVISTY